MTIRCISGALRALTIPCAALALAACAPKFVPPADYQGGFLWDSEHSRTVTVGPEDTLYSLSQRYDVPTRVIIARNNLQPPYALKAGQTLEIDPIRSHRVKAGETLEGIAEQYNVPKSVIVESNSLQPPYQVYDGQNLWIPDPFTVAAATSLPPGSKDVPQDALPPPPPRPATSSAILSTSLPPPPGATALPGSPGAPMPPRTLTDEQAPPVVIAKPQPDDFRAATESQPMSTPVMQAPVAAPASVPTAVAPTAAPAAAAVPPPAVAPVVAPPPIAAPPAPPPQVAAVPPAVPPAPAPAAEMKPIKFVWPVKGRLLSGFGPAGKGVHNDGINIAAPLGTQVRAAGNGTVVYAGSELKGFGNLLLIKHDNGLTTAYAHNDKLLVAKGDTVRQGQVIATVGKSGNVEAPQLHFEVRRGTQAVDPEQFLQR